MKERLLLPTLSMVAIVTTLVTGLGTPLIAQMAAHFNVGMHEAQWVLTVPLLVGAVSSPLIGRLAAPGRQRAVLLASLTIVVMGLLLSALPLGFTAMLIGRAMQGIGLALAPVAMSIASRLLGPEAGLPAIANLSSATVAAAGFSYPLSSIAVGAIGIEGVYWIGFAIGLVTLACVWLVIPRETAAPIGPIDWFGAVILAGGSGALLLMLSQLHTWGPLQNLLVSLAAAVLIVVWVLRGLRVTNPLIDLRVALNSRASVAHVAIVVGGTGSYLLMLITIQAAQDESGAALPLALSGVLLVPYSLLSVTGANVGNRLRGKLSLVQLMIIGMGCYALATAMMAVWHSNVWVLLAGMAVGGIGSGFTFAVIPQMVVASVPAHTTSVALSFNVLLRYIGFSMGSAITPVLIAVAGEPDETHRFTLPFAVASGIFLLNILAVLLMRRVARR